MEIRNSVDEEKEEKKNQNDSGSEWLKKNKRNGCFVARCNTNKWIEHKYK